MKKKEQKIAIKFSQASPNTQGYDVYDNIVYKRLELAKNKLRFLHLERKGNSWILLDALCHDTETIDKLTFVREKGEPPVLVCGEDQFEISTNTALHLPNHQFWHLDELPDGKWRLAYTDGYDCWTKPLSTIEFVDSGTHKPLIEVKCRDE